MDREEAIRRLRDLQGSGDTEGDHRLADDVLCDLLRELGFADVVEEWVEVPKWYA
jgi:hypothetical protein